MDGKIHKDYVLVGGQQCAPARARHASPARTCPSFAADGCARPRSCRPYHDRCRVGLPRKVHVVVGADRDHPRQDAARRLARHLPGAGHRGRGHTLRPRLRGRPQRVAGGMTAGSTRRGERESCVLRRAGRRPGLSPERETPHVRPSPRIGDCAGGRTVQCIQDNRPYTHTRHSITDYAV